MDVAELVSDMSWMRRLALTLVRDPATAEDLVQETWVAALRHPPRPNEPARPWLAQVLRNTFFARLRSDSRRGRREQAAFDGDAPAATADQLVSAVEEQRLLAEKVLALDEPYRSTILQCFYEGLTAAEVAARSGVPAGTVRWRLKEALDRLRKKMDAERGADRGAWFPALLPLSPPKTLVKGALAMKIALAFFVVGSATAGVVAMKSRHTAPKLAAPAPPATPPSKERPRLDSRARAAMLERLHKVPRSAPSGPSTLDKSWVSDQIREILPLFKECFERALERLPDLEGKVVIGFTIVADPTVGGLVSDSQVLPGKSTIADPELRECIQENIYAAQFPPPPEGGDVYVEFPFVLKSPAESPPPDEDGSR